MKGCGSYPVEVYGKLGESVISVCKKAQKGLKDDLMVVKKWRTHFLIYLYFKRQCIYSK